MKTFAGFAAGQFGDLVIQTVAVRALKQEAPSSHLTFCVGSKYRDILPLFARNLDIDAYHVWDGYDNWPSQIDHDYCAYRRFDHVFSAMPPHTRPDWYNHHHYAEENCLRYGLKVPSDLSYNLVRWFPLLPGQYKTVTLSLFPSKGGQLDKTIPLPECERLCVLLKALGYTPVQLGGRFEVPLVNAVAPDLSILEAAQLLTSSRLHITADTAFASIAAGYKAPTLGFYSLNYPDMIDCASHLPPNRNALYLKNRVLKDLTADEIVSTARAQGLL